MEKLIFLACITSALNGYSFTKNNELGKQVFNNHCGACHKSTLKTAKPDALAVFDMDQPFWLSKVSIGIKDKMLEQVEQRVDATPEEMQYLMPHGWQNVPNPPSQKDIRAVKNYLFPEFN